MVFLKVLAPEGSVYLLKSEKLGFYKIGYTRQGVRERTRQLNEEMDVGWEVVSNILTEAPEKLERYFHKSFEHHRLVPSREWFVLTEDEVNLFVGLAQDQRWIRERASEAARKEARFFTLDAQWSCLEKIDSL